MECFILTSRGMAVKVHMEVYKWRWTVGTDAQERKTSIYQAPCVFLTPCQILTGSLPGFGIQLCHLLAGKCGQLTEMRIIIISTWYILNL